MNALTRTGAILTIRPDGIVLVYAAGQRIEIPGVDLDEKRLSAVTGLTAVASAAGAPIATLIVESAAVRPALIAGDAFTVGDVLEAETAAAIDVDGDGGAHVQMHGLQVDVEGEDVRAAALTLVADVAAALERSIEVTATEDRIVRHLRLSADGVPALQEPSDALTSEAPTAAPDLKSRAVKPARPHRRRAAPIAAPIEPTILPPDEALADVVQAEPEAAATGETGASQTDVDPEDPRVDVEAESTAADDADQTVQVRTDSRRDGGGPQKLLEIVEAPIDRDLVDDEQHRREVEHRTAVTATVAALTLSKEPMTVPVPVEANDRPSRGRKLALRARQTATVLTLVAVIAGLTAAGISGVQATAHSDALAHYALASADLAEVRDDVRAALEEAQALGDLSTQVTDESTTTALTAAIEHAIEFVEGEEAGAGASWRYWTKAALSEQTDAVASETTKAKAVAAALEDATRAVNASHESWAADQDPADLAGAIGELAAAIDAAAGVLAESDGRVGDNAVRQALADAISTATTARDSAPGGDAPAPERAAAAIAAREQVTALQTAQQAVTVARSTWEAGQTSTESQQPADDTGNTSTGASTGSGAVSAPSNAGTAATADSGAFAVDAAAVPPSADRPGVATVQVAVSGNAGESAAVLLTVAGITTQIGTISGSGIVTGSAEGLPTGTWPWHVTVAGLQASGTPDIRVY